MRLKRILPLLLLAALSVTAADLSGRWLGTLETSRGVDAHFLTLRHKGGTIAGIVEFNNRTWEIQNAKFDGSRLTFEVKLDGQSTWVLAYDLKLDGGELAGRLVSKQAPVAGGRLNFVREK